MRGRQTSCGAAIEKAVTELVDEECDVIEPEPECLDEEEGGDQEPVQTIDESSVSGPWAKVPQLLILTVKP